MTLKLMIKVMVKVTYGRKFSALSISGVKIMAYHLKTSIWPQDDLESHGHIWT